MKVCNRCGNTGKTRYNLIQCDVCGRESTTRPKTVQLNVEPLEIPLIPESYALDFDSTELRRDGADRVELYIKELESIISTAKKGGITTTSHFVYAPKGRSKKYFAYTLIRHAEKNGLSTVPLLDTLQIQEFINATIDEEKAQELRKYYGNLDLNRILYADVLVVEIPSAYPNTPRFKISKELLKKIGVDLEENGLYRALEGEIERQNKYAYDPVEQVIEYLVTARKRLGKYTTVISNQRTPWLHDDLHPILYR